MYSWRRKIYGLSQSKNLDAYSVLNRGFSSQSMSNASNYLNCTLDNYADAPRLVVLVLMPEFFYFSVFI